MYNNKNEIELLIVSYFHELSNRSSLIAIITFNRIKIKLTLYHFDKTEFNLTKQKLEYVSVFGFLIEFSRKGDKIT